MELPALIFGAGLSYLVVAAVMAYLYHQDGGEHLRWWSFAFGLSVLRAAVALGIVAGGYDRYLPVLLYTIVILAGLFLMRGTYAFVGRPFSKHWYLVGGASIIWSLVATVVSESFFLISAPIFFFRGLTDVIAGVTILSAVKRNTGAYIAGVAFVLWGLHRWDYPFLRQVEWFAPWGFELAAALGITVAIGMLALHYERTRDELDARERKYRNLFENSIEGFIRTDMSGNILAANPALVSMLGYHEQSELLELNIGTDIYADPEERARIAREYSDVDFLDGVETLWKRADGSVRNVELMTRRYVEGGVTFFEGSVRDITDAKNLREQLEVARRMESLGRLAGGVAHDFNNVLTAIIGGIELARLEARDGMVPIAELESIDIAARQGADLSRRLLAFSRQDVEIRTPQNLKEVLDNSEAMLSRLLPTTVELAIDVSADDLWVDSEPGQLERVIVNLAVNAEQAMPEGGELSIRAFADSDRVIMTVSDSGVGMDESVARRIFEPFFTTRKFGEGTGMGLATSFKIIDAIGGTIDVDSEPGAGATFTIVMPSSTAVDARETDRPDHDDAAPTAATILLAEDDPQVRGNLVRYLSAFGFDVIEASNGEEAYQKGIEHRDRIKLAVFDVIMPRMTGPAAARKLNESGPELIVLFMSGYAAEELREEGIDEDRFLPKPFSPRELVAKIRALIASASPEQADSAADEAAT